MMRIDAEDARVTTRGLSEVTSDGHKLGAGAEADIT